jgi:D-3-phosphoglycerate dehydrogenase
MKNNFILVGTTSFSSISVAPLELLKSTGYNIIKANNRKFNEQELYEILPTCMGIIAGTEPYNQSILSLGKYIKVISRIGVGLDNVDLDYAAERNIVVKTTNTDLSISVSELTITMLLSLYKNINKNHSNVINKSFKKVPGQMLSDKVVGIVGLGKIGKATLKLLKSFNCHFLAFDKEYDEGFLKKYGVKKVSLEDLFAKSDIICLHLSYSPELHHLINRELFNNCTQSPVIINTSRGLIIDESDLIDALDNKLISGAALDVFEKEPYNGPLCDRDDVLLTPHIASFTKEVREKIEIEAVNNLIDNL